MVKGGDGVYIEPNLLHSAVCLKAGMLIDVFSPVREDFLDGSGVSYFGDKNEVNLDRILSRNNQLKTRT